MDKLVCPCVTTQIVRFKVHSFFSVPTQERGNEEEYFNAGI
ncbi:MAG: hypothetical protein Q7J27_04430 [Syntrophales bacterium]|nr:hypothetical protein [Syntrophales bacterium]